MRLLAGIVVLATASAGGADVHPVKRITASLYFSGHGGAINGVPEGGMGPMAEIALGTGRTQGFLEAGVNWVNLGNHDDYERGVQARGGLGVRWIAESFELDDSGAVEMVFDGLVGAHKFWWDAHADLARPEIGLGVGLQVRKYADPSFSVRFHMRVVFAPTRDDDITRTTARCASACDPPAVPIANGGVMFAIGGGF